MDKNYDEIEINLLDLFRYVLNKWKIVVVIMLICCFLGGAYGLLLMNKDKPETQEEVKALTEKLTNEEILDVEDSAAVIKSYREMYKRQKLYNEKSIFQNLDAHAINSLSLAYYVDNHYQVSYPVIEETNDLIPMVQMYISSLMDESLYVNLSKAVDTSIDPTYYQEIVSVDTEEKEAGIFIVKIYANTDELLEKIGDFIKESIDEKKDEVVYVYGNHDIVLMSDTKTKIVDNEVAIQQQKNLDTLTEINSSIMQEEATFSGNQLLYLKYLVHEEYIEEVSLVTCAIVGAIIGFAISICALVCRYLFVNTIKTGKDAETIIGERVIGVVSSDLDLLVTKVNNIAKNKNSVNKIAIISNEYFEALDALKEKMSFASEVIIDPNGNIDAFKELSTCNYAIIVVTLKKTKFEEVETIKAICEESNISILGSMLK